ncbi:MAG: hypothetical protein WA902_14985 [Thermosynechococcaceae cyanobacterium]
MFGFVRRSVSLFDHGSSIFVMVCVSLLLLAIPIHVYAGAEMPVVEAFRSGATLPLSDIAHLTFFATAGCLAVAHGIGLPVLLAVSATAGAAFVTVGITVPAPAWGLVITTLGSGWLLMGQPLTSRRWVVGSSVAASVLQGSTFSQPPAPAPEALAYWLGLLLGPLIIGLAAYQVSFWLLWHLADRADVKFRLGGAMVIGIGLAGLGTLVFPHLI